MNYFLYENFCNNENFEFIHAEIEKLNNYILQDSNILLYSKRKFGKTTLVKEYFNTKIDNNKYIPIYIDLFDITNSVDFVKLLYKQISYSLPYEQTLILKKLKEFFLRVNFTAIMQENGSLDFTVSLTSYDVTQLLADIYKGLDKISTQTNKKIIFALDEFQQIKLIRDVNLDVIIRDYIHSHTNIQYIFLGMKRLLLLDMFKMKKSPLYNIAILFELGAIPIEDFYKFINHKFDNKLSYEIFEYIYKVTDGEAKLIQEFCYHLYHISAKNNIQDITINDIEVVCKFLMDSKSEYFKMLLNRLSLTQKMALKAIIISDGIELYTKSNLFKLQVSKTSLNTAIKYLYNDELIDKENGKYYISNKCFELWYRKKIQV